MFFTEIILLSVYIVIISTIDLMSFVMDWGNLKDWLSDIWKSQVIKQPSGCNGSK